MYKQVLLRFFSIRKRQSDGKWSQTLTREKSETSLNLWDELKPDFYEYFSCQYATQRYPKTNQFTQALLFIKIKRPDISNVDFLGNNSTLIAELAHAYSTLLLTDSPANRLAIRNLLQIVDRESEASTLPDSPTFRRVRAKVDLSAGGGSAGAAGSTGPCAGAGSAEPSAGAGAGASASAEPSAGDEEKACDLAVAQPANPSRQRFHFFSPPLRAPRSFLQNPAPTTGLL